MSFGMTGHKRHPTIFPVISMRLQDDQFCAECFAEERSHSYEGVSPIGSSFTEWIFIFFSLGEKRSQSRCMLGDYLTKLKAVER
jgi:hypothetical protein